MVRGQCLGLVEVNFGIAVTPVVSLWNDRSLVTRINDISFVRFPFFAYVERKEHIDFSQFFEVFRGKMDLAPAYRLIESFNIEGSIVERAPWIDIDFHRCIYK